MRQICLLSALAICSGLAFAGNPAAGDSEKFVTENWDRIAQMASSGSDLRDEAKDLPLVSLFSKSKRSQNKVIARHLAEGRSLLLSTDARKILADYDRFEAKIADLSGRMEKLRAESVVNPEKGRKLEKEISKLKSQLAKLEKNKEKARNAAAADIRALGLNVNDASMDVFLSNVGSASLIDNTVVAGNVRAAVDKLLLLMKDGDIESSRRYFGMYLVLVDVQLECFRQFLEENDEKWLPRVDKIIKEAKDAKRTAEKNAADKAFTERQREIFIANAASNEAVLAAAAAYRKMLESQAATVVSKKDAAEKIRATAQNSYDTVRIAGDLAGVVRSGRTAFDAVAGMELPELSVPADSTLIAEFEKIAKSIKGEQ